MMPTLSPPGARKIRNTNAWVAAEASFGNGFLERLEHRQQYKLNGSREFT